MQKLKTGVCVLLLVYTNVTLCNTAYTFEYERQKKETNCLPAGGVVGREMDEEKDREKKEK